MSAGVKVLYVEDNLENRILIRRILEAEGFEIFEAENARQAFQSVQNQIPDLILMDINMPQIDGYALTSRLKTIPALRHVPIVALTANVMKGDKERTIQAGCDGYIQKPVDVDSLPQQVLRFLGRG